MKCLILVLVFLSASGARALGATPADTLAGYFQGELGRVDELAAKEPLEQRASYPLQDINIDVSPTVSFGVSEVFQLTVAPEIDFVLVPDAG